MLAADETKIRPSPYSLLITDDDESCRKTLADVFAQEGYDTLLAACGREAIRIARERYIHVAILDIHMPDLSGIETLSLIRQEIRMPVPCVFISAHPSHDILQKALAAELSTFLQKPLNMVMIREVVNDLIRRYYRN